MGAEATDLLIYRKDFYYNEITANTKEKDVKENSEVVMDTENKDNPLLTSLN